MQLTNPILFSKESKMPRHNAIIETNTLDSGGSINEINYINSFITYILQKTEF
jgi:hypothetical protein